MNLEDKTCTKCGSKKLVFVEYDYTVPERYDGISEIDCLDCEHREGRWSGKTLLGNEKEHRDERLKV